jgi:hypothetical protein
MRPDWWDNNLTSMEFWKLKFLVAYRGTLYRFIDIPNSTIITFDCITKLLNSHDQFMVWCELQLRSDDSTYLILNKSTQKIN